MFKQNEFFKIVAIIIAPVLIVGVSFYLFFYKDTAETSQKMKSFSELINREIIKIAFLSESSQSTEVASTQKIEVEVVTTTDSITMGLSGRPEIGADGMLFIFRDPSQQYFWMKDMKFNIDIIWILDNRVVAITENAQKPEENTPDNRLRIYPSEVEADMVLEVVAGDAQRFGITEGKILKLVTE